METVSTESQSRSVASGGLWVQFGPHQRDQGHLTWAELEEFRRRLLHGRQRLVDDIARLEGQTMRRGNPGGGNGRSATAETPDDTWQQMLALVSIDNKRSLLREIDQALDRMARREYGICVAHNAAISKSLLEEVPWTKYCSSCVSRGAWGTRL